MRHIVNILTPQRVISRCQAKSKKEVIQTLSTLFSEGSSILDTEPLFDAFIAREELGSTALGHGVAIPHIRSTLAPSALGAFLQLDKSIDFDAEDKQPTDIIFALVVPANQDKEHLELLSEISQLLISEHFRHQVRESKSSLSLFELLHHPHHHADCA